MWRNLGLVFVVFFLIRCFWCDCMSWIIERVNVRVKKVVVSDVMNMWMMSYMFLSGFISGEILM